MDPSTDAPVVTIQPVSAESRPVVERLAQLERHDLSERQGWTPDADGLFPFPRLPRFFAEPDHRAYLIHHGPALAGFALTRPGPAGEAFIHAFFIVRALRRHGVGLRAALQLLRWQPGPWSIVFQEENAPAARFWRRVATAAVGSAWREQVIPPHTWLRLEVPPRPEAG